jgi:CRP-like cAMP-binding protein
MNQTIYRENDLATEIYLIQEGEVEISRNIEIKMKEANESEKLLVNFVKNTS